MALMARDGHVIGGVGLDRVRREVPSRRRSVRRAEVLLRREAFRPEKGYTNLPCVSV